MAARMLVCRACGRYALHAVCPECGAKTASPHPARFSPEDRFGKYRRRLKQMAEKESESRALKENLGG